MKIQLLESHDRLLDLRKKQSDPIAQGASDCLMINPLSLQLQDLSPYIYIYAHPRTGDDGVTKRMLWQPRLTKPKASTNSYLFRAISKSDILEVIWLIPPREMWEQYDKGKLCDSEDVRISIQNFLHHREALERPDPKDYSESRCCDIYDRLPQIEKAMEARKSRILNL